MTIRLKQNVPCFGVRQITSENVIWADFIKYTSVWRDGRAETYFVIYHLDVWFTYKSVFLEMKQEISSAIFSRAKTSFYTKSFVEKQIKQIMLGEC